MDDFLKRFDKIILFIEENSNRYEKASKNIAYLKTQYTEMLKTNNKKVFLFSLDSFFYQYKVHLMELEQIKDSSKVINNRIYIEYYKLLQIIQKYLSEIQLTYKTDLLKTYPPCKELDQTIEYKIEDIKNIFENVTILIGLLNKHIENNNSEIENYDKEHNIGFSISNFIITLRNENITIKNQVDLFTNYILFFLSGHKRQLYRIYKRINNLLEIIEEENKTPPGTNLDNDEELNIEPLINIDLNPIIKQDQEDEKKDEPNIHMEIDTQDEKDDNTKEDKKLVQNDSNSAEIMYE
jgi:hypothetical protein